MMLVNSAKLCVFDDVDDRNKFSFMSRRASFPVCGFLEPPPESISSGNDMLYNLHRKIYSTKEKTRIYRYRLELYVWNDQYSFL